MKRRNLKAVFQKLFGIFLSWFGAVVLLSFISGAIMAGCTIGWVPESAAIPTLVVWVFGSFMLVQLDAARKLAASGRFEVGPSMVVMFVMPMVGALFMKLIESLLMVLKSFG